jgi:hypothetical protein
LNPTGSFGSKTGLLGFGEPIFPGIFSQLQYLNFKLQTSSFNFEVRGLEFANANFECGIPSLEFGKCHSSNSQALVCEFEFRDCEIGNPNVGFEDSNF